jgi:hypothetical protein
MATAGTRKKFDTEGPVSSFTVIDELEACDSAFSQNITGKIAVVYEGGTCSSTRKALNLQDAGVAGMLVYPHLNNTLYRRLISIPVASMTYKEGTDLVRLLNETSQQPSIRFTASMIKVKSAGQLSE